MIIWIIIGILYIVQLALVWAFAYGAGFRRGQDSVINAMKDADAKLKEDSNGLDNGRDPASPGRRRTGPHAGGEGRDEG